MVALSDVLWLGGPSGAGKSTVARFLARRHGLRWYSGDTRTWEHRDRALRANDPDALRFETLTPEQRASLPWQERRRLDLRPQRRGMVLDDLAHLPPTPLVIADSTLLEPAMARPGQAVWVTASPAELLRRVGRRGWGMRSLGDAQAQHDEHRQLVDTTAVPVVVGDGRGINEIVDQITELFGPRLATGPLARGRHERQQLIREGNIAIAAQYRAGLARYGRVDELRRVVRAFDCECGDAACQALLDIPIAQAPATPGDLPLLDPRHAAIRRPHK